MIQARFVKAGATIKNFAGEPEEIQTVWPQGFGAGARVQFNFASGNVWTVPAHMLVTPVNLTLQDPYAYPGSKDALIEAERILREEVVTDGEYSTRTVEISVDTLTELTRLVADYLA